MLKLKLFSVLCMMLMLAFSSNISAQDAPHSFGMAPQVDNIAPQSGIFGDANPNSRQIFCISTSVTAGQKLKGLLSGCTGTNLGAAITYFPGAYTRVNPNYYFALDQIGLRLLRMDSLGTETLMGTVTGSPQANLTGIAWDANTGTLFALTSSLALSQISRLDTTTRVMTPIGSASAVCAGGIAMGCSPAGTLFVVDIVADNLYKVSPTTGVFTLVGPLGGNANFGQDCQFDYDGILYWASYITGPALRTIDTTTGGGVQICAYVGTQATAIATIPAVVGPPPAVNFCRNGLNIVIPALGSALPDSVNIILGAGCNISDVNIRIDTVIHTFDGDLRFYVRRTVGNVGVRVINQVGGGGDNFIGTILDDEATTPIASGVAPFTGSFIPSSPLTPFDGAFTAGYWTLQIVDTVGGDSGFLRAWCVALTFTCPVGGVGTIEVPNHYSLSQNYPNPFNPSTVIKFGMPKAENVRLVIYDMLGREVRTLVNEVRNPGTYEVSFDASSLSSGVYFYRLETASFVDTKKMLLVK